jgi:hypothetical protein
MEAKSTKPRNHPYSSRKQAAAYFDGDGSVSTRVRTFTLTFSLEYAESYLSQLEQIREFLAGGVSTRPIKTQRRMSGRATNYVLTVYTQREVGPVCKRMLPYAFKKEWDLHTAIAYLEDRITGDEALRRLNISIETGRREVLRTVSMPFTKSEGINTSALIGGRRSSAMRAKPKSEKVELPRSLRDKSGETYAQLARLFGVSSDVVKTALGKK